MAFSFFFRDLPILETAIEEFIMLTAGRSRIHVWVAGSAMGQEVYTLGMLMAEKMGTFAFKNVFIKASDIELEFKQIIETALYPTEMVTRIPSYYKEKYFCKSAKPNHEQLIAKIRERVTFVHHDLLTLKPVNTALSMIICKNVLLHFQPHERVAVFRMFHKALAPNGILANENTQKLPPELEGMFEQVRNNAHVYRKVEKST